MVNLKLLLVSRKKTSNFTQFFLIFSVALLFFSTPFEALSMNLGRSISTPLPGVSSKIGRRPSKRCEEFLNSFYTSINPPVTTEDFSFSVQETLDLDDFKSRKQKPLTAKRSFTNQFFQVPKATLQESKPVDAGLARSRAFFEASKQSFLQITQDFTIGSPSQGQIEVPNIEKGNQLVPFFSKPYSQSQRDVRVRAEPEETEDLEEDSISRYNRQMDRVNATGERVSFKGVNTVRKMASVRFERWNWIQTNENTQAWEKFQKEADVAQNRKRQDMLEGLTDFFEKNSQQLESLESQRFIETGSIAAIDQKIKTLLTSLGFDNTTQDEIYDAYFQTLSDYAVLLARESGEFDASKYFSSENQNFIGTPFLESADKLLTFLINKTQEELDHFEQTEMLVIEAYKTGRSIFTVTSKNPYEIWENYKSAPDFRQFSSVDLRVLDKNRSFRETFCRFLQYKRAYLDQKNKKQKALKQDLVEKRVQTSRFLSKQALFELSNIDVTILNLNKDLAGQRLVVAGILAFYNPGNVGPPGILNILLDLENLEALFSDVYRKDGDFREFFDKFPDFKREFRANCLAPEILKFEKDTKGDE